MNPVTEIDIPFDKEKLLNEANIVKSFAKGYTDDRYPGMELDKWLMLRHTNDYIKSLMRAIGVEGKPRFYWLEPNAVIPEHVDNGTLCAVNFVLTENPAPVNFSGEKYTYKVGVLDTTKPHSVVNGPEERILFKISIVNEDYETVVNKLLARFSQP